MEEREMRFLEILIQISEGELRKAEKTHVKPSTSRADLEMGPLKAVRPMGTHHLNLEKGDLRSTSNTQHWKTRVLEPSCLKLSKNSSETVSWDLEQINLSLSYWPHQHIDPHCLCLLIMGWAPKEDEPKENQ
ncbi:Malignant Fibrous Histiocytoma-Amplified Sequence 1 [Manis pentadactyla]|nr:Malignant Fibrous Histiocytoma-Amplified Sequence 1 [Manis pentadactyla]